MTAANGHYDVAIIGGGPGGTTVGTLLRKYDPALRILILEKEKFPRDHIGESQLPPISVVLDEMGCWDKVEAANFPIKVGATFRWGSNPELWDFEFLPLKDFADEPRPARYEGQRKQTAFQVDRSIYDQILLQHAEEKGCEVREETPVARIEHEGDRITGLTLENGQTVTARYYIDASGYSGIVRRALGVRSEVPTTLLNVAFWDYWENAEWAVRIGVGGTRIQIMSQAAGWIWFIPLGPTRTSIGFVCPGEFYKKSGKTPEALYQQMISGEERVAALTRNATRTGHVRSTKDWSFVAERAYGENWFLVGEAAGFADPILSAGLTLTHTGGRELAYTILELNRGGHDPAWLKDQYDYWQRKRVRQHIRFADFWYAANGQFTELKEHCQSIAQEAGLKLTPASAWRWLAQGGFSNDVVGQAGIGGFDLTGAKQIMQLFTAREAKWELSDFNVLKLDLNRATEGWIPLYHDGKITRARCYHRGEYRLAVTGMFELLLRCLDQSADISAIYQLLLNTFQAKATAKHVPVLMKHAMQCLEVMINEGWVTAKLDPRKPRLELSTPSESVMVHPNRDQIGPAATA
ncbi:hypothetical protein RAS1_12960 [Phycisphaerae bacterium RAS1]|nr:hypothetical protein RAS1_12960 [Phycisphaerae bacterium RAS1]